MDHEPMDSVENEHLTESSDSDESENSEDSKEVESDQGDTTSPGKVYLPGQQLEAGEELVVDKSAYRMLHQAQSGAPCLSFDVISDQLGAAREVYPLSMYLVAGTQAARTHVNNLLVMKITDLSGIKEDSDDDSSDTDDESKERIPTMAVAPIKHQGCVNRVRCTRIQGTPLAASWSELGRVHLWDMSEQLKVVEDNISLRAYRAKYKKGDGTVTPLFTFKGHLAEGYAVDWCPTEMGTLATGDCKGNIHLWRIDGNAGGTTWHVDQRPYNSHAPHSVEDVQWSPNERHVLSSCSVDKSIKIWDTRVSPQSACMLTASGAHSTDINVVSWNRKESQFLLSGGDDGLVCVWDLREFNSNNASPVAIFKQHTAPITTVEWSPQETTVFASGGADDQIAQWDLSVETDTTETSQDNELSALPPQLLFIHQGQTDIKELHWHPQCPGVIVSTALSGFNIFRTISV